MVGRSIGMIVPDSLRPLHDAGYRRFVETGRGHVVGTTVEVAGLRADGREFPMELSLSSAGAVGPPR
jgi:PAS domain S-box-containing protein